MNRFSIEGSGAHLSEGVTLKHAHSSRFAHPTATFDPSIHISIERPTHWCQNIPNPPPIGTRTWRGKKRFARSGPPWLLQPFEVGHRDGDWAFFRWAILLTWCRCSLRYQEGSGGNYWPSYERYSVESFSKRLTGVLF